VCVNVQVLLTLWKVSTVPFVCRHSYIKKTGSKKGELYIIWVINNISDHVTINFCTHLYLHIFCGFHFLLHYGALFFLLLVYSAFCLVMKNSNPLSIELNSVFYNYLPN
jgi:hypothetical protein